MKSQTVYSLGTLRGAYEQRQDYLKAELALDNVKGSIERRALKQAEGGQNTNGALATDVSFLPLITAELDAHIKELHKSRKMVEKTLEKQAQAHPLWPFVQEIRGVGPLSFGQVIAEAGDLLNYSNPAKLWKRFGLAVLDGEAQARRKGAKGEMMGFSPRRRAILYNVSECLLKQNHEEFRALYDAVKAQELTKGISLIHAHKRAMRRMAKQFLKVLWQASRKTQELAIAS